MNLNKAFIIGRLTADVKLRTTPSGMPVASFGVATNRYWTDKTGQKQEKTDFHNVVVWGRTAEIANQYLVKGSMVFIEGRIENRSWDAPDGTKKWRTEIIAERIQFGPRLKNEEYDNQKIADTTVKEEKLPEVQLDEESPLEDINPDEVPF